MRTSWKRGLRVPQGEEQDVEPILGCRRGAGQGLLLQSGNKEREMGRKMFQGKQQKEARESGRIRVWPHSAQCPERRGVWPGAP